MAAHESDVEERARRYADVRDLVIGEQLGHGNDGTIWATNRKSAIKVELRETAYQRELGCYLRLRDMGVTEIEGFEIPCLIDYDDELWVIEMGVVEPPCLLDFGKAHLDCPRTILPKSWPIGKRRVRTVWRAMGTSGFDFGLAQNLWDLLFRRQTADIMFVPGDLEQ